MAAPALAGAAMATAPPLRHDTTAVARLVEMGFEAGAAHRALAQTAGDEAAAAEILLAHGAPSAGDGVKGEEEL